MRIYVVMMNVMIRMEAWWILHEHIVLKKCEEEVSAKKDLMRRISMATQKVTDFRVIDRERNISFPPGTCLKRCSFYMISILNPVLSWQVLLTSFSKAGY